ncbi:MAG: hypothetical protein R3A46_21600, partial [Thermomicrobiales bacterium]
PESVAAIDRSINSAERIMENEQRQQPASRAGHTLTTRSTMVGMDDKPAIGLPFDAHPFERLLGGAIDHQTLAVEAAAVAGAVEFVVSGLPPHQAAPVGTARVEGYRLVQVYEEELAVLAMKRRRSRLGDFPFSNTHLFDLGGRAVGLAGGAKGDKCRTTCRQLDRCSAR